MSYNAGYNARIKKGSVVIAGVKSGSFNTEKGVIDITALGSLGHEFMIGLMNSTLELVVMLDTESTEQNALWDAYLANTKLTDIEIYYDATAFITCDTFNDTDAGIYVTKFPFSNLSSEDSVIECALSLQFSGLVKKDSV